MKRTLGVLLVIAALVGAAAVGAADQPVPAGFTPNAKLSAAASWVAGKQVIDYCAASQRAFDAADEAATGLDYGAAYSYIGGDQTFLSPWVCGYLLRWQAKKPVTADNLGKALLAFTHEAELLTGESDESLADCKALAKIPQVVAKFFPLRHVYTLHVLMRNAWDAHDASSPEYQTNCPER